MPGDEMDSLNTLRVKAEAMIQDRQEIDSSSEGIPKLLHELQVNQIELEIQNEDLRRVQQEIERSRNQFARLFHQAPVGYLVLDEDGLIRQANDTFARMVGQETAALIGKPLAGFLEEPDRTIFQGRYKAIFKRPAGRTLAGRLIRPGLPPFHVRLETASLEGEDSPAAGGPSHRILVTAGDVNDLMQAEKALRKNEQFLQALFETIPAPIFYKDAQGRYQGCNSSFEAFWGRPRQEIIGRTVFDVAPPEIAAVYHRKDRELMEQGGTQLYETDLLYNDGTLHRVMFHKTRLSDDQLEGGGLAGVILDITDRKRAEEALRESEERLALALEGAEMGMWDWDIPSGRVVFNRRWAEMIGFTLEEIEPSVQSWEKLVHGEDLPSIMVTLQDHLEGRTPRYESEFRMRTKSGEWKWILDKGQVISRDGEGRPLRAAGTHLDITERKRLEEQLRQAQKMEAIGTLAGGVAHEFNNMLGAILGSADMALLDAEPLTPLAGHLRQIRKAARRSADLTRQILAFARKQITSPKYLDLNEEIPRILDLLRPLLGERVDLVWKPGAGAGGIKADPGQVDQILTNLIINARDAIPGSGTIEIETAGISFDETFCLANPGAKPGKHVRLTVKDTGTGIGPENLPHIFEPFFTTKEVGQGTGLGLSTVFGIINQNGGYVSVSSEPGRGTVFHIDLPRREFEGPVPSPLPEKAPRRGGSETVLLVEDEEQILNTGKIMLERHGYKVLAARHSEEALDLFDVHREKIALVVTDVVMPGLTGRELWERLSARKPGLKGIFVSAYPAEVITDQGLLAPGAPFIEKPFSLMELIGKVREVLDRD